ncbi:DUF1415 domain-containing protein [Marilutibacter chinensis]|uniref:DUF1415 domain-containing protein n=1 Tax=Marilutibacter chinensis TaxID=2912247 RepID=A0ABS9HTQ9_9GAMM|nr:DUF1415 domain-containing protein [Lysobacter chinensis]MCF7222286.1 DUF1415 domain-containing protein [Lysobacter chinensis]
MNTEDPIVATRRWLERAVIGLNLCPFAKAVHAKRQIRYVHSPARTPEALLEQLADELRFLHAANPDTVDTTLLVHPQVLGDFLEFNDFLDDADALLARLDLEGEIQVASFHPDYRFAGTGPDEIGNFTNRAPYPTLHLLREASIDRAIAAYPDPDVIVERNIATLEALGIGGWRELMRP